jgi:hypothetical protein
MYCQQCGAENPEDAKFCRKCGCQIATAQVEKQKTATVEVAIKDGSANHYKGLEAVGGKLYLTNQRLKFKSHKLNIQVHEMEIPLNQIVSIEKASGFLAFKQINVHVKDSTVEKFVVNNREEWINAIMKQKNQ